MSTLAAAVFSFVFTTSANAAPKSERPPKSNLEIRGKDAQEAIDNFLDDVFGIRVKIRVK